MTVGAFRTYRAPAVLPTMTSRYTFETLRTTVNANDELRQEHRGFCRTNKIDPKFICPKVDVQTKVTTIYAHFQLEKKFQDLQIDLGLDQAYAIRDSVDGLPDPRYFLVAPDPDAIRAADGTELPDDEKVFRVYVTRDLFDLTQVFTLDEIKNHCVSLNTDVEPTYALVNQLSLVSILNNLDSALKEKVKTKLNTVDAIFHGGALALFYIRDLISNSSAKQAEHVTNLVRKMKITAIAGENVELATNQMKSMLNILTTAGRPPDDEIELLLEFYQTTTNAKFNAVFHAMLNLYKLWGAGTPGQPHHISTAIIYAKAIEYYDELVNIKKWIKLQKAALMGIGDETPPKEDGDKSRTPQFPDLTQKKLNISKQVAAGSMTAEQAKVERKKIEKEKKERRKKTDKATETEPAALAAATSPNNNKKPEDKIREIVVEGVKLKGDFSRPSNADMDKPRTFTKSDGSGTMELHWCRMHGYCGQWQAHTVQQCPMLGNTTNPNRSGGTNVPPSSGMAATAGSHVHWANDPNSFAYQMRANGARLTMGPWMDSLANFVDSITSSLFA